jgi:hypothetical protein
MDALLAGALFALARQRVPIKGVFDESADYLYSIHAMPACGVGSDGASPSP